RARLRCRPRRPPATPAASSSIASRAGLRPACSPHARFDVRFQYASARARLRCRPRRPPATPAASSSIASRAGLRPACSRSKRGAAPEGVFVGLGEGLAARVADGEGYGQEPRLRDGLPAVHANAVGTRIHAGQGLVDQEHLALLGLAQLLQNEGGVRGLRSLLQLLAPLLCLQHFDAPARRERAGDELRATPKQALAKPLQDLRWQSHRPSFGKNMRPGAGEGESHRGNLPRGPSRGKIPSSRLRLLRGRPTAMRAPKGMESVKEIIVIGGGLAGCEAAWQLAERGHAVRLVEMKPIRRTPAQVSDNLAELVCSNSFRSRDPENAVGLLHEELRKMGSLIFRMADRNQVPAGGALAVDRVKFSEDVTRAVRSHPRIRVEHRVVEEVPETDAPVIVATGPLTEDALARSIARITGAERLHFYDAIAPIVAADSIDRSIAFAQSRYGKGGGDDYLNLPMDEETYRAFVREILAAEKVVPHDFEDPKYFEGCLPIEVMAERGEETLAHGPMKPVGLVDPRTGRQPYAVVQLRPEDVGRTAYNMVGFQTRLTWPEQRRVFRMIPGLQNAE